MMMMTTTTIMMKTMTQMMTIRMLRLTSERRKFRRVYIKIRTGLTSVGGRKIFS